MRSDVLLVEDHELFRKSVARVLLKEGYTVHTAGTLTEAKELCNTLQPVFILLDIMLPDGNGHELIPCIRDRGDDAYIIMLTSLTDAWNKKTAYEKGADDYLCKPFDIYELIYKLKAAERRIVAAQDTLRIGDLRLDCSRNELVRGYKALHLQPSQSRLLKVLYENYLEGSFLDREDATRVLQMDHISSSQLHTLVSRLRHTIYEIGSEGVMVESVYARGYMLVISKGNGPS